VAVLVVVIYLLIYTMLRYRAAIPSVTPDADMVANVVLILTKGVDRSCTRRPLTYSARKRSGSSPEYQRRGLAGGCGTGSLQ
jgi:hypothetical protein